MDCPKCGLNLALVGRRTHVCRLPPGTTLTAAVSPEVRGDPETNMGETNQNETNTAVTNKDAARSLRWRARNPEKYRAYQRVYMAKRRARAK